MEKSEYQKLNDLEKSYWWHRGKTYLVRQLVQSCFSFRSINILEIGSGTGHITTVLQEYGEVTGLDISPEAIKASRKKGIKNLIEGDINSLDLKHLSGSFDCVLALDVLEHIQDDMKTIRTVKSLLKKGGYFLINVPAHKFLWSEHDEALHHKRRYSKTEITQKLIDAGFKVDKVSYFVSSFFIPIALFRLATNIFTSSTYPKTSYLLLPEKLNDLMTIILKFEAKFLKYFSLPIGVTLVVIARKP